MILWLSSVKFTERSEKMKIGTLVFYKKSFKTSPMGVYHFFGVKRRSYAGSIVKRIYDYFCGGAKNLFLEYLLCYRKEYESYEQFLLGKYNLFEYEVKNIISWRLYCKDLSCTPDINVKDFLEYDEMKSIIRKLLGEIPDED